MESVAVPNELDLVHNLRSSLNEQINELELLQSMYSGDELVYTNSSVLYDVKEFVDGKSAYIPPYIDFTLTIMINNLKVEICINLPSQYPTKVPTVNVRCNQLNRKGESQLNQDLCQYICEQYCNEVCLCSAIFWIQENIDKYYCVNSVVEKIKKIEIEEKWSRCWIYSHHIYNKGKRELIVNKAKQSGLTGFCLSGKPGIICIEGREDLCSSWWKHIKSLNWQKIMLRNVEEISEKDIKFSNFEEICKTMSDFSKFMADSGFSQIFNELFGFIEK